MKRFLGGLALAAALSLGAGAARAQIYNMPVFFSPGFGTGVGIYGDFGMGLNDDTKLPFGTTDAPQTIGGHAVLGLSKFTIMAGVGSVNTKETGVDNELSYGGNLGLTIYRTPASMVVVNIQAGAGYIKFGDATTGEVKMWNFPIGVGLALDLPVVGWFVEPWIAPRVHIFSTDEGTGSETDVGFGLSGGINANLLLGIGAWAALDWLTITPGDLTESVKPLVLGLGLSWKFSVPGLGMASGLVGG